MLHIHRTDADKVHKNLIDYLAFEGMGGRMVGFLISVTEPQVG